MSVFPILETERLRLRDLRISDAETIQTLLNEPEITGNLMDKALPYSLEDAQSLITYSQDAFAQGKAYMFAIERKSNEDMIGYCDVEVQADHQRGEIAYWIGLPYWWQGYATEAAKRVVRFGFEDLALNRIYAYVMKRNEASAHVLQKAGLIYEGTQRHGTRKNDVYEDVDFYGLLREDWLTAR
ncbi:MAG: GNAT family N-acetyltransferase [Anaerolineaceae bacterium]|nr:GNAT family N-acetyltransferase [Anaerolineaceae bacterium]